MGRKVALIPIHGDCLTLIVFVYFSDDSCFSPGKHQVHYPQKTASPDKYWIDFLTILVLADDTATLANESDTQHCLILMKSRFSRALDKEILMPLIPSSSNTSPVSIPLSINR